MKNAEVAAKAQVGKNEEKLRRTAIEKELRSKATATVRRNERLVRWEAAYRKQFASMGLPVPTPLPAFPDELKIAQTEANVQAEANRGGASFTPINPTGGRARPDWV